MPQAIAMIPIASTARSDNCFNVAPRSCNAPLPGPRCMSERVCLVLTCQVFVRRDVKTAMPVGRWRLNGYRASHAALSAAYSSSDPTTLPVFGFTRCTCSQATHLTNSKVSPFSDPSSANQPCTSRSVLGQVKTVVAMANHNRT